MRSRSYSGPAGSSSRRRTRSTPRAETGSGWSSRSAIASSWPRCERTAPRFSGAEPGRMRGVRGALDAGRSTPRDARARSTLVSSPARQTSSGDHGSGVVSDEQAIGRRSELRERALLLAGADRGRERERDRADDGGRRAGSRATSASSGRDERERSERGRRAHRAGQLERLTRAQQGDVASRDHAPHGRSRRRQGRLRLVGPRLKDFLKTARRAGTRRRAR